MEKMALSHARLVVPTLALLMAACGGGGSGGSSGSDLGGALGIGSADSGQAASTPQTALPDATLQVATFEVAQTHVIPPEGKSWNLPGFPADQQRKLTLVGDRTALVLVHLAGALAPGEQLTVEATSPGRSWSGSLASPATLPPTEAGQAPYSADAYWAHIPADQVQHGLSLRVVAQGGAAPRTAPAKAVDVANSPVLTVRPMAFYLFGADPAKTVPESRFTMPDAAMKDEYFAKMPVSRIDFKPLPPLHWDYLVVWPGSQGSANTGLVLRKTEDITSPSQDEIIHSTLFMADAIQSANGDKVTPTAYFAFAVAQRANGTLHAAGGLAAVGDYVGAGDFEFGGTFFHELGHGYGMPHATDGWNAKQYPYVNGTLSGSAWGYDSVRRRFLSTLIAPGVLPASCAFAEPLVTAPGGRCYKNDPMQGGAELRTPGDVFAMFSDFNAAQVQFAITGPGSARLEYDAASSSYRHWDASQGKYVAVPLVGAAMILPATSTTRATAKAFPTQRDVPVHTIAMTISSDAGRPFLTQIYPVLSTTGNLIKTIDPDNAADLADIDPAIGKYPDYCRGTGCEFTLRVTYADGTRWQRIIPKGFYAPGGTVPDAAAHTPTDPSSMIGYAINVPGQQPLAKVELLDTPHAYLGVSASAKVLASRLVP